MLYLIKREVYLAIREYGQLKPGEASAAMKREHQLSSRLEGGDQMPTPEQEALLVEKVGLSKSVFVELMCRVLSTFLGDGRRVMIVPRGQHLPISPIIRAGDLYDRYQEKLSYKQCKRIERLLNHGRRTDVSADHTADIVEDEVRLIIKDALEARGERLLDDDEA